MSGYSGRIAAVIAYTYFCADPVAGLVIPEEYSMTCPHELGRNPTS